jgi:hypothetical protein
MEFQYLLEGFRFYLLPSVILALIPTISIFAITLFTKEFSNLKFIFLCLGGGIFMLGHVLYWSLDGFLVFPLGTGVPVEVTPILALVGGAGASFLVCRSVFSLKNGKRLSSILMLVVGYLIFVFISFSILNNRWVA